MQHLQIFVTRVNPFSDGACLLQVIVGVLHKLTTSTSHFNFVTDITIGNPGMFQDVPGRSITSQAASRDIIRVVAVLLSEAVGEFFAVG